MNDPKSNQPGHDDVTRLSPTVAIDIDRMPTIVIPTAVSPEMSRDLTDAYVGAKVPKLAANAAGRSLAFVVPQRGKRTLGGPDIRRKEDLFYSVLPGIEAETEFATLRADPRGVLMTLVDETPHTVTVFSDAPPRTYAASESLRLEENSRLRLGPIVEAVFTERRNARDDRFDLELAVRYLGEVSCEISRASMRSALNALGDDGTHPANILVASGLVGPEAWHRAVAKGAAMLAIERCEIGKRQREREQREVQKAALVGAVIGAIVVAVSTAVVYLVG